MRTPRTKHIHLLPRHALQQLNKLRAQRVLRVVIIVVLPVGAGGDCIVPLGRFTSLGARSGDGGGKVDLADGGDEGDDFDAVGLGEVTFGDGAGGDAACLGVLVDWGVVEFGMQGT